MKRRVSLLSLLLVTLVVFGVGSFAGYKRGANDTRIRETCGEGISIPTALLVMIEKDNKSEVTRILDMQVDCYLAQAMRQKKAWLLSRSTRHELDETIKRTVSFRSLHPSTWINTEAVPPEIKRLCTDAYNQHSSPQGE